MNTLWRRTFAAVVVSLSAVAGSLWVAAPAHAVPVESGTFAFSGDPDDYISQGLSYSYTAGVDNLIVTGTAGGGTVSVFASSANGDNWLLEFDATGSDALAPGTYTNATRYPFNDFGPGLSLAGNGRGCNTLTGTFTIDAINVSPNGYVQTLDATFEQHCEGGVAAARGEVHIANPPPPPALEVGLVVDGRGEFSSVNGSATVHGTVTCNRPATMFVNGNVVQVSLAHRTLVRGSFSVQAACTPEAPGVWSARVDPQGSVPFTRGDSEVQVSGVTFDPDTGNPIIIDTTIVVELRKPRQ